MRINGVNESIKLAKTPDRNTQWPREQGQKQTKEYDRRSSDKPFIVSARDENHPQKNKSLRLLSHREEQQTKQKTIEILK